MTDSELYSIWGWSLGVAAVVVILAALLLIAILLTARSILQHAREAEQAVARIAEHTQRTSSIQLSNSRSKRNV
jgi:archaellum component FlaF (FlaF/FlaG flagellin family)